MTIVSSTSPIAYIYAYHAGDYHYRYCGVTTADPWDHLSNYQYAADTGRGDSPLTDWLKVNKGCIRVSILEIVDSTEKYIHEKRWIKQLLRERYSLLNVKDGIVFGRTRGLGNHMHHHVRKTRINDSCLWCEYGLDAWTKLRW